MSRPPRPTRAVLATAAGVVLGLSGCAGAPTPVTEPLPPQSSGQDGATELAPRCEELDPLPLDPPPEDQPAPDLTLTTADPIEDLDLGEGLAGREHGMAIDQARAWAEREAGDHYAGMWQDTTHGALVFGFTEDIERYAEGLRDRFGDGLWVVERPVGYHDLLALTDRIGDEVRGGAWDGDEPPAGALVHFGPSELLGRVTIGVYELDDERTAELTARFGADRICVEGSEPVRPLPLGVPAPGR